MMSSDLKETARGGVAATPTGMRLAGLSVASAGDMFTGTGGF